MHIKTSGKARGVEGQAGPTLTLDLTNYPLTCIMLGTVGFNRSNFGTPFSCSPSIVLSVA